MAETKAVLESYKLEDVQETGGELGRGSYAVVVKVNYKGLWCAGKKIHRVLCEQQGNLVSRFEGECRLLSQLRHPHIVQFLGVYFDHETNLPVLVMEFLSTTLSQCLDQYGAQLPDDIRYSVLRDVALGLRFLHDRAKPIIHRDLSANNVLLTADMTAKISDLGVAKIVNLPYSEVTKLTQAPGTPSYMPPEALVPNPSYSVSIDVFSFGILIIHVFSGKWPSPTEAARVHPSNPNELLPFSEADRRQEYLDVVGANHPLMALIHQCIHNNPFNRPTTIAILEQMNAFGVWFPASVTNKVEMLLQIKSDLEKKQSLVGEIQQLMSATASLEKEIDYLKETSFVAKEHLQLDLAETKSSLAQREKEHRAEIRIKEAEIRIQESEIAELKSRIGLKEDIIVSKDEIIASKDEIIASRSAALERRDLSGCLNDHLQHKPPRLPCPHLFHPHTSVHWQTCTPLPENVVPQQAVMIHGALYCRYEYCVIQCELSEEKWSFLPPLDYKRFGLGQLCEKLVAIGGRKEAQKCATNKLHVFCKESNKWKESLPPMPHARYGPTVFSYNSALIVCGGEDEEHTLDVVDVYKCETSQWCTASPLPYPWCFMRSTVIGEKCYLMGGYTSNSGTKLVLVASLPALVDVARPVGQKVPTEQAVWTQLPDVPHFHSAAGSVGGSLLALGGQDKAKRGTVTRTIFVYSSTTSSWIPILELPVPRAKCIAITLPTGELRVIGGLDKDFKVTNTMYGAKFEF